MAHAYRLQPAHRRKLRRLGALVDTADGSPDELAAAREYLGVHASCEAYLDAQMTRTVAPARPRCARRFHKHYRATVAVETKICPVCLKQKSWVSFDDELGT